MKSVCHAPIVSCIVFCSDRCCCVIATSWSQHHDGLNGNPVMYSAKHRNTLQHTATHCSTLQHTAAYRSTLRNTCVLLAVAASHCSALQHNATQCNALQNTAHVSTHRNILQHTTTLFSNCVLFCLLLLRRRYMMVQIEIQWSIWEPCTQFCL